MKVTSEHLGDYALVDGNYQYEVSLEDNRIIHLVIVNETDGITGRYLASLSLDMFLAPIAEYNRGPRSVSC